MKTLFTAVLFVFIPLTCFAHDLPPLPDDVDNSKAITINTKSIILADVSDDENRQAQNRSPDEKELSNNDKKKAAQDNQEQPIQLPPRKPIKKPADNTYKNALSAPSKVQLDF